MLRADVFADVPWLVHGFSTREGGVSTCYGGKSLNLGLTPHDLQKNVERNRELFEKAVGAIDDDGTPWSLLQLRQIHSAIVHRMDADSGLAAAGDGIVSNTPGLLLAIKTADCVPVLVADVKRRVVGAFHAGWRGTVARVVEKGVGEMRRQFGSDPRDLRAAIGPCIRKCCYSVGAEVRAEFESQFSYCRRGFRRGLRLKRHSREVPVVVPEPARSRSWRPWPRDSSRPGCCQQAATGGRGSGGRTHLGRRRLYGVRHPALLFAPRGVRQNWPDDGGDRDSPGIVHPGYTEAPRNSSVNPGPFSIDCWFLWGEVRISQNTKPSLAAEFVLHPNSSLGLPVAFGAFRGWGRWCGRRDVAVD